MKQIYLAITVEEIVHNIYKSLVSTKKVNDNLITQSRISIKEDIISLLNIFAPPTEPYSVLEK